MRRSTPQATSRLLVDELDPNEAVGPEIDRLRLAAATQDPIAHPRDLAALSRQVVEITKELDAAKAGGEEDHVGQAARTADEPWQSV